MRCFRRSLLIALAFFLAAQASGSEPQNAEDATLRSVFFIDQKEGWAVGDENLILHTLDGGETWKRQRSGLRGNQRASLRSVQFLTPFIGWAVGREELPYGMGSVGIVLFTSDGGLEWKQQLPNMLPGLNQVRFVDVQNGFFFGDGGEQFPSGVFKTSDSGKSWNPVPGPRTTSWLAGDFFDPSKGMLAGGWSRFATLRNDKANLAEHAGNLSGRDVNGLVMLGKKKALAVGQGGLILQSQSEGGAWDFVNAKLPAEVLASLDFNGICALKDNVWVAGRPGSVILHSSDAGKNWELQKTGSSLPLHAAFFFDEKNGWAVGDAGTVLHSSDGGKSWTVQLQGGKRASGLCVHARRQDAPTDTLALLGGAEGYLMTSLCITAPDLATVAWGGAPDARRYAAAIRKAGALTGETLWHFPLPQHLEGCDKATILARWNELHKDQRAADELVRQLVLTLRIWRPSVVIGEHPASAIPLSALLAEAVENAVQLAADPRAFPEQIDVLGLQAWQVRKTYGLGAGKTCTLTQNNDEPSARLQATVRDYATSAHALLTDHYAPLPQQRMHQRLGQRDEQNASERHWMEGLEQTVGESRRKIDADEKKDDKLLQTLLQRRAVIALAENLDDPARTLALVPVALEKLPDEHAAPAAFAVASRFAQRGQWYLAQEVYLYMVDRYPYHPLSAEAYRWLIRLNTSGEARRRNDLKHFAVAVPLGIARKNEAPSAKDKEPIRRAGFTEPATDKQPLGSGPVRDWNKGSRELMTRLGGFGPIYGFDPATQFCLQSARRRLGEAEGARDWFSKFGKYVPSGPWHDAAKSELWLSERNGPAPRRTGRCGYTEVRPYLDGKFDDLCWQNRKPMILDDAVGKTADKNDTEVMFAFDQEFLYVALKCKHPAGKSVAPVRPRSTDAPLDAFDRVSILLDVDRDYATCYHLEVDQRGCVRDDCWGDRSWNPRWFVAVHGTDTCWQIEAAIPLAELTGDKITQQTAWAFNVVRILPGQGVQSWTQPADVHPRPEGMSLLEFQPGTARPMRKEP